jgi:hypothetical protein
MKKPTPKKAAKRVTKTTADGAGRAIEAVFEAYPAPVKSRLLALRRLIFDTAKTTTGVGALEEALKWGQPSYLTTESKSGSTDPDRPDEGRKPAGTRSISTARPIWSRRFGSAIRNCAMAATAAFCSTPARNCPRRRCATASRWR